MYPEHIFEWQEAFSPILILEYVVPRCVGLFLLLMLQFPYLSCLQFSTCF